MTVFSVVVVYRCMWSDSVTIFSIVVMYGNIMCDYWVDGVMHN